MQWIKKHPLMIFVILLQAFLINALVLSAYEISYEPFQLILLCLPAAIATSLLGMGLMGFLAHRKWDSLIFLVAGAVVLYFSIHTRREDILLEVAAINDYLAQARDLSFDMFRHSLIALTILMTALSYLTYAIYPLNLIVVDMAFLFFLWGVDRLGEPRWTLLPLAIFWILLFIHQRVHSKDQNLKGGRATPSMKKIRLRQGILLFISIALGLSFLTVQRKGYWYAPLWAKANDFLMQDQFLSGRFFADAFDLSATGYSDSSHELGGDVNPDDGVALLIMGDAPAYLRGNTRYLYNGKRWQRNDYAYRTNNSVAASSLEYYKDLDTRRMEIVPAGVSTSSFFVPDYPFTVAREVRTADKRIFYGARDQTFLATEPIRDNYTVIYADTSQVRDKILKDKRRVPFAETEDLALPDSVTERTRDLAEEVAGEAKDRMTKASRLKDYLKKHYEYSLVPGETPEEADFVDDFLFSKREGYCVYFASALTILARSQGIPARYVEGFKVPQERDAQGRVIVRNSDAHAWTEIQLENGQWVSLDATGTPREMLGGDAPPAPALPDEPSPGTRPEELTLPERLPPPATQAQPEPEPAPIIEEKNLPWQLLLIPLLPGLIYGAYLWKRRREAKLLESADSQDFLAYVVDRLQEAGLTIGKGATLKEISQSLPAGPLQEAFRESAKAHYASRYGGAKMDLTGRKRLLDATYAYYTEEKGRLAGFLLKNFR